MKIEALNSRAAKLAKLVQDHGDYEFEGFTWLRCNLVEIGDHLGMHKNTIRNIIIKPPFKYITRNTKENGRHLLVRIGDGQTETDHLFILRTVWAKGLIYYNAALAYQLTSKVAYLKSVDAPKELYERLLHRITAATEGAKDLEKLKTGQKVSMHVSPHQMGQLRGIVQTLGEDAQGTVACLVTFQGWHTFTGYLKAEGRLTRHYHWPQLGEIMHNPDIAIATYLDTLQGSAKISIAESNRLLAKIEALTPKQAA